ncbi:multidrug effflux MFS transporter [Actinokineospora bangkokensis]|uniref:Bcr/CflA family drug resistance efflux transporter n=1 Tax=Actinokineospora bangkokensis TaxID=1193682 RepID=A0A1Q9LN76_9PSEU|nr:multidrug effflux MFS transporter [Actinokineospora bangkokensis]OLR93449.1 Bcr/CflA family drug resistance efflux transporter [Actinokineospora bangkokensis]
MTNSQAVARGPRARVILVLGALIALGPLTIDMYLPALPELGTELRAAPSMVQLTLTGTLIGLALGTLVIGPLSDALGRRKPVVLGISVHVAASLLCLVAPSIEVLGLLRVVQGMGGAAASVVAFAVVRDLYEGHAAAVAMTRLMLVMGTAPVLAPSLGAAVLLAGSWRWVFAVLAGLGLVLIAVAHFLLPETLDQARRRPLALRSVLGTYRGLLADTRFVVLAAVAALSMGVLFAYVGGSSFVLQDQFGLDEQQFGLVFAVGAVSQFGLSQFNPLLLRRMPPERVVFWALSAGLFFAVVLLVVTTTGFGGLVGFLVPVIALLTSVGFVLPNAPALALSRHGEAAGTASALLSAAQFTTAALVAPLVGVLGNDGPAMAATMVGGLVIAWVALVAVNRAGARRAELVTA